MLVLTRKPLQRIQIGDSIVVTIVRIDGNNVRVGIEAPGDVPIHRQEVLAMRKLARRAAKHLPACADFAENSV